MTNQKLVQNTEVVNLMAAIGLKLGQRIELKDLRYGLRITWSISSNFLNFLSTDILFNYQILIIYGK